jgi:purine-binding chemotaxis protein CheW
MKRSTSRAPGKSVADRAHTARLADAVQLVAFSVGTGEYALDIMRIKEIVNVVPVTPVPRAPAFIEGVIELRGAILPVVDMRKRFDLPATLPVRATKYLIVAIDVRPPGGAGAEPAPPRRMIVGLIVDRVSEPIRVARDQVRPAPALAQAETACFTGVVHHHGRILMILDLDAILSSKEKLSLAGLGPAPGDRSS